MVSHDLRFCFLELVHFFVSFRKPLFSSPSTLLHVRATQQLEKSKMAAGGMSFAGKVALITGTF